MHAWWHLVQLLHLSRAFFQVIQFGHLRSCELLWCPSGWMIMIHSDHEMMTLMAWGRRYGLVIRGDGVCLLCGVAKLRKWREGGTLTKTYKHIMSRFTQWNHDICETATQTVKLWLIWHVHQGLWHLQQLNGLSWRRDKNRKKLATSEADEDDGFREMEEYAAPNHVSMFFRGCSRCWSVQL